MKKVSLSEWKLSVIALAALLGTFISIIFFQRELNLTFAIWYLSIFALVVAGNAIYVFYKRKRQRINLHRTESKH